MCQQERNRIDMLNSCETEPDEVGGEIKDILKTKMEKNISKISKKKISKWLSKQTFIYRQQRMIDLGIKKNQQTTSKKQPLR